MRKILFGLTMAVALIFTACNDDDGYSLGKYWVGFGIYQGGDGNTEQIVLDNEDILVPVAASYPGWASDFENGDRILVNYTILDEVLNTDGSVDFYYVKVNEVDNILMKGIMDITEENADSIGNDPIIVSEYWMSDSLLNVKLKYWGYNEIHYLNLVKQPGEITADDQPFQLELRHNANEDSESIPYTAFVSFSLNSLRIAGLDSVSFQITSTDYDGEVYTEDGVFNYSDLELPMP
ncbi:NigD-like protein [uncultured Draconibacterium sp.]|uniref:NigD-like protein n=1 Tax=uncultured Draconibacterium sp. TaxID=1573823 RepID=UPI0032166738